MRSRLRFVDLLARIRVYRHDFVRRYLDKAIFHWQWSRKWAVERFGRELKAWLADILLRMPDADWRAEWQDFAEDSRSRGVEVTEDSKLLAFLEQREKDLLEQRALSAQQQQATAARRAGHTDIATALGIPQTRLHAHSASDYRCKRPSLTKPREIESKK